MLRYVQLMLLAFGLSFYTLCERMQPYFENGRYYNVPGERNYHADALKILGIEACKLPMTLYSFFKKQPDDVDRRAWSCLLDLKKRSEDPVITWLGHACVLIQVSGLNIITDPVFGRLGFPFLVRYAPDVAIDDLPPIDLVIISHNHRDHMDEASLRVLADRWNPRVFVPEGDKALVESFGFSDVIEHMWWQEELIKDAGVTCAFLPAVHWSCRGLRDRNRSLWGSWIIVTDDHTIYFGGDTAYGDHFSQIKEEYGPVSIALLPIAPIEPYMLSKYTHMNGYDTAQATIDLEASVVIPIHWGTFGPADFAAPMIQVRAAWNERMHELQASELIPMKFFQSYA